MKTEPIAGPSSGARLDKAILPAASAAPVEAVEVLTAMVNATNEGFIRLGLYSRYVSSSTLSRMAQGRRPDAASLAALSAWSGLNPATFIESEPPPPAIRFGADALASAIREMVKADIQGDGERYTMHETVMREQLGALQRELNSKAGREVRFK